MLLTLTEPAIAVDRVEIKRLDGESVGFLERQGGDRYILKDVDNKRIGFAECDTTRCHLRNQDLKPYESVERKHFDKFFEGVK